MDWMGSVKDKAGLIVKEMMLMKNIFLGHPILCVWQVTARCDFTCRICHFWKEPHSIKDELTTSQIRILIEKMAPIAPLMMTLAGGEPLLRADIHEIVKIVSQKHFCSMITNGWYMTRSLARKLYDHGLADAMVSIDYATPGKHDLQRGRTGAFEHALKAIEYLRDTRPDKAHKVRILAVLMDDNIDELEGLLLLAQELGVSFALTLYSNNLGKKPNYFPDPPVSDYLIALKKKHPHFDSVRDYLSAYDRALKTKGIKNCGGGKTFINMDEKGDITRCIDQKGQTAGNPLRDPIAQICKTLLTQRQNKPCSNCWTSCRGLAEMITGPFGIRTYPELRKTRKSI